ncbi:hypothetical protein [Yeosuana sp.]|uniref:hypothetical protein n=1 Tax=Yeosuana sp. TaxID=2529388 RepID=UPI00404ADB33
MKKLLFSALILLSSFTFKSDENDIVGLWHAKDENNRKIEIYQDTEGLFQGKSVTNFSKEKSSRVLKDLKYDSKSNSYKGKMSPPDMDMTLDVTITVINKDELKLEAEKFLITKTMHFNRTK